MVYKLEGNWKSGFAIDKHTISSEYLGQDEFGHDRFNNTRSEMGELVYQLKYKHDTTIVNKIVDLVSSVTSVKGLDKINTIVPIPPSNNNRQNQPVFSIARELGSRFGIKVYLDVLEKLKGSQELKGINDFKEREKELNKAMKVARKYDLSGKNILLIDDLYRSGATLKVATNLLYSEVKVKCVYVLTMTKTRSNR